MSFVAIYWWSKVRTSSLAKIQSFPGLIFS